jgi:alpha-N-acetylglucosaminidase
MPTVPKGELNDMPTTFDSFVQSGYNCDPLCCPAIETEASNDSHSKTCATVYRLIARYLPEHGSSFKLQMRPQPLGTHGYFTVEVADQRVHIDGTSGVELASGFHWFLKYFCNSSMSWELTGGSQVNPHCMDPSNLDRLEAKGKIRVDRAVQHTFYQNVVTLSYSMAFWEWER